MVMNTLRLPASRRIGASIPPLFSKIQRNYIERVKLSPSKTFVQARTMASSQKIKVKNPVVEYVVP